jgi:glycogenin glucosyltransferase
LFLLPDDVEFAASPELGFPDCFNSGVMVLKPSESVFEELVKLAKAEESLDGGDQGLLNVFFGDGSRGHPSQVYFDGMKSSQVNGHISGKTNGTTNGTNHAVNGAAQKRNWYRLSYMHNVEMHQSKML